MGFSDKFKNLAKQAQDTVAANADKLHEAVETVGVAVNEQTQGKYARHIQKVGDKAGSAIDKVGGGPEEADATAQTPTAPVADAHGEEPAPAASSTPAGSPSFGTEPAADAPSFSSEPASQAPPTPPSGDFPSFDE